MPPSGYFVIPFDGTTNTIPHSNQVATPYMLITGIFKQHVNNKYKKMFDII